MAPELPADGEPASRRWPLQTANAILLALVSLLGAFIVWRTAVAADAAGDASLAGILATLNAEEVRALNTVEFYEHYRAFAGYAQHLAQGNQYETALETAAEADRPQLEEAMAEAWDIAESYEFPRRYLNRDGTYNAERELGEAWAEALRGKDLEPAPHFAAAVRLQTKSGNLIAVATLLAAALVAHTLAETMTVIRLKNLLMGTGIVISLASLAAFVLIETGTWP